MRTRFLNDFTNIYIEKKKDIKRKLNKKKHLLFTLKQQKKIIILFAHTLCN